MVEPRVFDMAPAAARPAPAPDGFARRLWCLRPTLLRRARRHLPSPAWAEDAVAETLLVAVEQHARLHTLDSLEAWLVGVLRHKIGDQLRLHRRHGAAGGGDDQADEPPAPAHDAPEAVAALRQWLRRIECQLQQLPPLQAEALRLHLAGDAGASEIAQTLGVTANHSGVLLHRARSRLRALLPEWAPVASARGHAHRVGRHGALAGEADLRQLHRVGLPGALAVHDGTQADGLQRLGPHLGAADEAAAELGHEADLAVHHLAGGAGGDGEAAHLGAVHAAAGDERELVQRFAGGLGRQAEAGDGGDGEEADGGGDAGDDGLADHGEAPGD